MAEVQCPFCEKIFIHQFSGRAAANVPFTAICKGLREAVKKYGRPNFSEVARYIAKKEHVHVSGCFVAVRLNREADARGIKRSTLIQGIIDGTITEPVKKYKG